MVQESWSWDHGKVPIQDFFLFPFIKHAVLNGQTAHTKGCLENRCGTKLLRVKWSLSVDNFERRIASMPGTQAAQPFWARIGCSAANHAV